MKRGWICRRVFSRGFAQKTGDEECRLAISNGIKKAGAVIVTAPAFWYTLQGISLEEPFEESNTFRKGGNGDVFVYGMATGRLGSGHAYRRETQGVFR